MPRLRPPFSFALHHECAGDGQPRHPAWWRRIIKAAFGLAALLLLDGEQRVSAATGDGASLAPRRQLAGIRIATNISADIPVVRIIATSETAVALRLKAPVEGVRFLRLREVPASVKLTHGFRLHRSWVVSAFDLDQLAIIVPADFAAPLTMPVLYYRGSQEGPVAETLLLIERAAPRPSQPADPAGQEQVAAIAARHPEPTIAARPMWSSELEAGNLRQGAKLMQAGDIAAARLLFEELVMIGSAGGARAMAETFDPAFLEDYRITGLRPDVEAAKKWYRRAAEMGDPVSVSRIGRLETPP
jgi:hypothetical protein